MRQRTIRCAAQAASHGLSIVFRQSNREGEIVDEEVTGENVAALRAFNDKVAADERVEVVVLPAFDGLTIARKL